MQFKIINIDNAYMISIVYPPEYTFTSIVIITIIMLTLPIIGCDICIRIVDQMDSCTRVS